MRTELNDFLCRFSADRGLSYGSGETASAILEGGLQYPCLFWQFPNGVGEPRQGRTRYEQVFYLMGDPAELDRAAALDSVDHIAHELYAALRTVAGADAPKYNTMVSVDNSGAVAMMVTMNTYSYDNGDCK